jgi:DNA-binding MarR family transcriptional regulator
VAARTAIGARGTARARERARALALFRTVVGALTASARAVERHTKLTNAQAFLLQQLAGPDPLGINDLAARARTHHSTVSIVVARLARQRLVTVTRTRADARRVVVTLTAKGRTLIRRAPRPPAAAIIPAIDRLHARDVTALTRGLSALARAMHLTMHLTPGATVMLFGD